MNRYTHLIFIVLFQFAFLSVQSQKQATQGTPNFVLIVADDLGFADLSINGSLQIKTPNIDRIGTSGVYFAEGYVSSAVCSPSRAGLLSGINQVEFGYDNNLAGNAPGHDPEYLGLPVNIETIADHLGDLGYVSGLIGKWHLGSKAQFHPLNRGFDEFWGYTGGGHDYFEYNSDGEGYKAPIECNYKEPGPISYLTDDKGEECVEFIHRHKDKPFFLYAAFNAPHAPMQATEEDLELYRNIEDIRRRTYAAMVHRLDVNVGRILDALEEDGITENTLVVFLSDNGGPVDSNGSINAPYNGQKGILLDGGIHVPFMMSWPGTIDAGITFIHPVTSLDIAPTFISLGGGDIKTKTPFSGINILPFILGSDKAIPHSDLKWKFTISAAVRKGEWKLIRLPDRMPMLFNLSSDPSELNNIALDNLEKTEEMLKQLGRWEVNLPHPLFLEGAVWKKRQLNLYDREYPLIQPE